MMQHAIRQLRTYSYKYTVCPAQHAPVFQQRRSNYSTEAKPGAMGSLRKAYDKAVLSREDQAKERIFQTQLKYLSSRTPLTAQVFLQLIDEVKVEAGLGGFKKHLPWVANNEALQDFERQEAIVKALTPAERQSVQPPTIAIKKRITRATGTDLFAVDSLLSHITSMRSVQRSLLQRIDCGEHLPASSEELKIMMTSSGSGGRGRGRGRSNMPRPGVKQKRSYPKW